METTLKELINKRNSLVRDQMSLWKKPLQTTRRENSWISSDHLATGTSLKIAERMKKFNMY